MARLFIFGLGYTATRIAQAAKERGFTISATGSAGDIAFEDADAVAIVTEWDAFRALDLDRVKSLAKAAVMVDLRNIYRPDDMRERGFAYTSIGRE